MDLKRVFPTLDKVWISSEVSDPMLESTSCKANVDSSGPVVAIVLNQDSLWGDLLGVGQI